METAKNPFDELTSLFLGASEEQPPPTSSSSVREPGVTILLCGHLPVMAGLWVTQYAEKVAAKEGPTGLVRLEGGRCLLEILRPDSAADAMAQAERPTDLAKHVTRLASGSVRRWIVCVDDRDAAMSIRAGASEVVVLTSVDKPAMVEAYRLAKSADARVADPDSLRLGLVLVGVDDEQAKPLSERLAPVFQRHLDRELPVLATVKRIDVIEGSIRQMFEESARVPADEIVQAIMRSLSNGSDDWDSEPAAPLHTNSNPPQNAPKLRITPHDPLEEAGRPIRLSPAPVTDEPPAVDQELSMAGFVDSSPAPSDSEAPPVSDTFPSESRDSEPRGGLLRLLGLQPVPWRLPNAGGVEYGCDESGGLHLLARDADAGGLHVAAAWIRGQQDQFAAVSELPVESVAAPSLHVITEDPPRVADLHRCGLHLHLLVTMGAETMLVPLNDERNRGMPE